MVWEKQKAKGLKYYIKCDSSSCPGWNTMVYEFLCLKFQSMQLRKIIESQEKWKLPVWAINQEREHWWAELLVLCGVVDNSALALTN